MKATTSKSPFLRHAGASVGIRKKAHSLRVKQGGAIIGVMEYPDGWSFVCKLCGKKHEVPEEIAPYWKDAGTLTRIPSGEVALGCSENPGTAQYSFSDFTAFKVA
jgi:hypothetical protein